MSKVISTHHAASRDLKAHDDDDAMTARNEREKRFEIKRNKIRLDLNDLFATAQQMMHLKLQR